MKRNLSDAQMRPRLAAAHEPRQRAIGLLEDASMLDGQPVLHINPDDATRIAHTLGIRTSDLTEAIETLTAKPDTAEAEQ